ncbi:DUF4870 domain-containing protein [Rhodococcus sp. X156]|uniref:DUF4870 domain-containing protein n=1 Tax=Rhodococcus sp. X156 TaxID=2499145 RepID=UPI0019D03333|nr:DUF4870 domain-containing protein [Rhodococcus sp. X156]
MAGRQLSPDETTWSLLAHLSGIVLGFLGPLLVMLIKGNESPYTRRNAVEALNFQITLVIAYVISALLMVLLIGFLLLPLLYVADVVFSVLAGVAASKGQDYRYPFTWRFIS